GGESFRNLARVGQFVERRRGRPEADGERGQAPAGHLTSAGDDRAGIDPTRQEHAEWDVTFEPEPHRLAELVADGSPRLLWRHSRARTSTRPRARRRSTRREAGARGAAWRPRRTSNAQPGCIRTPGSDAAPPSPPPAESDGTGAL